jgi:tRNA(fMet)-specific endonuclease VapC
MLRYLLDTNTFSYFVNSDNPMVVARVAEALDTQSAALSVISRGEIRYGAALMDVNDGRHPRIALTLSLIKTLPWTEDAADVYGTLRAKHRKTGVVIGELDAQIAAHARRTTPASLRVSLALNWPIGC